MIRFAAVLFLLPACAPAPDTPPTDEARGADAACCSSELAATPLPGASLYQLEGTWLDQDGATLALADLRGEVVVISMVFSRCAYACPQLVCDMQRVEDALAGDAERVTFALVTIDPERDTPEVLRAWAQDRGLDGWRLLRSDRGGEREVAAVLGIDYVPTPTGDFAHSNVIAVLDADGVVVHRQEGLRAAAEPTARAVRELLSP